MLRGLPDEETVRAAVALAGRAPSVHNSQPWRWTVGDSTLHLFADWSRQLPATDPDGRDLLVSCGATLHHLRVALSALGWATTVHRLPNPAEPAHLAAVELRESTAGLRELSVAAAITARHTDRRRLSSWPVPAEMITYLTETAADEGAVLRAVTDPRAHYLLLSAMADAALLQDTDPAYAVEIAAWSGRHAGSREGVPAANIPSAPDITGASGIRRFPDGELFQAATAWSEQDAAALLVLGTTSDDTVSRLRAGEALSAVLLTATGLGMATCPLSQPLEIGSTREQIRTAVLSEAGFPQIVLRLGWAAPSSKPLPQTPRRPVSEILTHFPR